MDGDRGGFRRLSRFTSESVRLRKEHSVSRSLFTSESVSEGHPDKVADQISDTVLDAMLEQDPGSRVACETLVTTGQVVIAGEVTTRAQVDIQGLVRETIREIGYDDPEYGFDYRSCGISLVLDRQSPDISQGVDEKQGLHAEMGAGDQGMMFGYACRENLAVDAASNHACPQAAATAETAAQSLDASLSQAGREIAGNRRIRRRQTEPRPTRW